VVTYDPQGGYGHPDHVHAHRVTMRAVELAALPGSPGSCASVASAALGWPVPRLCWVQVRRSWAQAERERVVRAAAEGSLPAPLVPPERGAVFPPAVVPDDEVGCVVDGSAHEAALVRALRAHETQVRVLPPWYGLSNDVAHVLSAVEGFRLARGVPWPPGPEGGAADDLFAGLDLSD
jgi:N-acetyl-1-D-myo-inositol-2-amino-2-deoxy-alpha-D-glucopyranoside deacetylase